MAAALRLDARLRQGQRQQQVAAGNVGLRSHHLPRLAGRLPAEEGAGRGQRLGHDDTGAFPCRAWRPACCGRPRRPAGAPAAGRRGSGSVSGRSEGGSWGDSREGSGCADIVSGGYLISPLSPLPEGRGENDGAVSFGRYTVGQVNGRACPGRIGVAVLGGTVPAGLARAGLAATPFLTPSPSLAVPRAPGTIPFVTTGPVPRPPKELSRCPPTASANT